MRGGAFYTQDTATVPDTDVGRFAERVRQILRRANPVARQLRSMGTLRVAKARLEIEAPTGGAAGDVSAIFRTTGSWREVPERTAVLFPTSGGGYRGGSPFVKALSPLWEPLQ